MGKKRKRNRELEEGLRKHCNVRDEFGANLEKGMPLAQCILKAQQAIDSFYSPEHFKTCKEDFDPNLLVVKYNKLHFEKSGRKETYRALLTGLVTGLLGVLISSIIDIIGNLSDYFSENVTPETLSETISGFSIAVMIIALFFIVAYLVILFKTIRDLNQRDSDPYLNYVEWYEEEKIKDILVRHYGVKMP